MAALGVDSTSKCSTAATPIAASEGQSSRGAKTFDDGELITSWSRGPNKEFRMHLQEYRGHQFVKVSEWAVNPHNSQWFPSKDDKGRPRMFTIKVRELEDVATALRQVKQRLE